MTGSLGDCLVVPVESTGMTSNDGACTLIPCTDSSYPVVDMLHEIKAANDLYAGKWATLLEAVIVTCEVPL